MLTAPGALTGAEDKDARGKIRILVVDDSVVMRQLITRMLAADAAFEVVGFARDGLDALDRVEQLLPDLVTLDIEMPQLDGLGTLRILQQRHPRIRVVMCSSLTERGASVSIDALLARASDYVTNQHRGEMATDAYEVLQRELTTKIRQIFALAKASPAAPRMAAIAPPLTSSHPPLALPAILSGKRPFAPEVLAIGVSTGGPTALAEMLPMLPAHFPLPVAIVQHMPPLFTQLLAERLAKLCAVPVMEGASGMELLPGRILIAPGNFHMPVVRGRMEIELNQEPPENPCRPAFDVLSRRRGHL